jgi:hypothetical protein
MKQRPVIFTGDQTRTSRAEELDALDAILPFDRREQLAELLTDDDVATRQFETELVLKLPDVENVSHEPVATVITEAIGWQRRTQK